MIASAWKRWMAVGDVHGDHQDPEAVLAALEWMQHFKPEIRVHGGDNWDLRWLRRGASEQEKRDRVEADLEAGCQFMRDYKPTHFLKGNHDIRLDDALESDVGSLAAVASMIRDRMVMSIPADCEIFPYCKRHGVMELGNYKIVHGFASGVGAVRKQAQTYGSVLTFHNHRIEQAIHGRWPTADVGWCCGCLCKLDLGYNRASLGTLGQEHGFAYGWVHDCGEVVVHIARKYVDSWAFPTEMREWEAPDGI